MTRPALLSRLRLLTSSVPEPDIVSALRAAKMAPAESLRSVVTLADVFQFVSAHANDYNNPERTCEP